MIHEKTKTLRDEKNQLNKEVCNYLETNQMIYKKIGLQEGEIKYGEKKEYSPLTFSFLEHHLGEIVEDEYQLHQIIAYLKDKREIKVSKELKRTYK